MPLFEFSEIDHVVGEVEAGGVQVLDDGRLQFTDPAPIIAAPKPLRVRLLPNIRRLVRKMDETEKRASWVEAMMTRVQRLLGRSDLRKLFIHMHFFRGLPKWFNKQSNIDFLTDLAGNFLQDRSHFFTRTDHTAAQLAACSYHCYAPENLSYNGSQ